MPDKVAFAALIKELSVKSLVSGDKEARIVLQFIPTDEMLDGINRLHRADESVMVAFVPIENTEQSNAIQKRSKRKPKG